MKNKILEKNWNIDFLQSCLFSYKHKLSNLLSLDYVSVPLGSRTFFLATHLQ